MMKANDFDGYVGLNLVIPVYDREIIVDLVAYVTCDA
jgi:hypothetical protein